ncbi:T9SS type B sorting domain-containing protein [Hymenobacter cellulosivorans]|uniref:Gliding motility-associated C-terminal domain-containing protein n=1 Tax=Hymenobacter cellulosivorans TaxID=2932249 RepID=A0ABY4FG97_9BACT|nr:gliding motility-associated C-terminal domain-containing protein [Hymenobacter cellulosivorans]UOQ55686.1 gliding motility-associated C-terminal domain-containing protein [Hymenobacter cellulosivorans]
MFGSLLMLPLAARAQAPEFEMAVPVGTGPNAFSFIYDMVVDAAGNSYIVGEYEGTALYGSATITSAKTDILVVKVNPAGGVVWVAQAGGNYIDSGHAIARDAAGNLYITGTFLSPTISFGAISLVNSVDGLDFNSAEVFVAKLDPNGNWLWATKGGGVGADDSRDIAVDAGGNAYITGEYASAAVFGNVLLPAVIASGKPASDVFVAKINSQGAWQWAKSGGSRGGYMGSGITLDAGGNLLLAGQAYFNANTNGPFNLTTPGGFVAKLTDQGTLRWATSITGSLGGRGYGSFDHHGAPKIATDAAGNAYISGGFSGSITLGSIKLTASSATDAFVAKLNPAGTYQWGVRAGGAGDDCANNLAVDASGNCFVTGSFERTAQFGPLPSLTSLGDHDGFTAMLTSSGVWRWATPAAGRRTDNGICVAVGPGHTTYMSGEAFEYPVKLGTSPGLSINGPVFGKPSFVARMGAYNSLTLNGDSVVCRGGQVQLTATTTGTVTGYRWSTGATTASISVSQAGTYSVTATFAGGHTFTETHRVQSITPTVQITGGTAPLCPGSSATLAATATGARSLRWSTGATTPSISVSQPGTYSVTAQFSSGCAATTQVTVVGNGLSISGRQQLCPGQSTTLTATGSGAAVVGYRWRSGETTPTLRVGQAGTYAVTATFADGCSITQEHTVGPPVAKVASVSGDTLLCPNTTLRLTALNPDALTYQWSTGATTPDIIVTGPGYYKVLLTYSGGCTSRDSLLVQTAPLAPTFTLGPDTTLCLEKTLTLHAPALSGPGVTFRWSDGSTGSTLRVTQPGLYSLRITTPCDTRTASRNVAYESCFFAPNVITPNGDNRNDTFVINELSRGPWSLEIYSRWGKKVYQTNAYQNDWGRDAAPGVYYYLLRPAGSGPATKGWLEVVR